MIIRQSKIGGTHWIGWGSSQAKLSFYSNILFIIEIYISILGSIPKAILRSKFWNGTFEEEGNSSYGNLAVLNIVGFS